MAGIVDIIKGVTGGLVSPVVDYLKVRKELASKERIRTEELKDALHQRRLDLAEKGLTADMSWEQTFADAATTSWKDEYTLIVTSIPMWMAFIPGLDVYVTKGFASFSGTPLWYQVMVQTLFYATVGIRLWRRNQSDT